MLAMNHDAFNLYHVTNKESLAELASTLDTKNMLVYEDIYWSGTKVRDLLLFFFSTRYGIPKNKNNFIILAITYSIDI